MPDSDYICMEHGGRNGKNQVKGKGHPGKDTLEVSRQAEPPWARKDLSQDLYRASWTAVIHLAEKMHQL